MLTANFYTYLFNHINTPTEAYQSATRYKDFSGNSVALNKGYPDLFRWQASDDVSYLGEDRRYIIIPCSNTDEYGYIDVTKKNNNGYTVARDPESPNSMLVTNTCAPYKRSGMIYTVNCNNQTGQAATINSLLFFGGGSANGYDIVTVGLDFSTTAVGGGGSVGLILLGQLKLDTPITLQQGEDVSIGWAINGIQMGLQTTGSDFLNDITTGQQET